MSKKILLADDSITIHKVISITFGDEDFDLEIVSDGDSAITKAREISPDLVMADVSMPGKSGYEVCETIKSDPQLSHIPVLILAGTFEPIDDEELKRVGADDFIVKPFESQELIDKVWNLLEKEVLPQSETEGEPMEQETVVEGETPVAYDLPPAPSEVWDEGDFISTETVEEKPQPAAPSGDDIWGGVLSEDAVEEPEKEELRKVVEEEFEELDLGAGDIEAIEDIEEIEEIEAIEEIGAGKATGVATPESSSSSFEPAVPEPFAEAEGGEAPLSEPGGEVEGEAMGQPEPQPDSFGVPELEREEEVDLTTGLTGMPGAGASDEGAEEVKPPSEEMAEFEVAPPDLTMGLESEEESEAPFEYEPTFQPEGVDDTGEVDEGGAVEGEVPEVPFEATALELEEPEEPEPFEAVLVEEDARPEIPELLEVPVLEAEPEHEPFEATPEVLAGEVEEYGVEETEPEAEVAPEAEPVTELIGVEEIAGAEAEVEPPKEVEELPEAEREEWHKEKPAAVIEPLEEVPSAETVAIPVMEKEKLEEIVSRVARGVLEEVAWEVIPEMVEDLINEEIRKTKEAITKTK
ncbi:MAG: response regulator [Deltaproteobacteria bacterium]|nr:response regulator [Deltaproteobacteria bacterium]